MWYQFSGTKIAIIDINIVKHDYMLAYYKRIYDNNIYLYISIISKRIVSQEIGEKVGGRLQVTSTPGSEKQKAVNIQGRKKYQMGAKWIGKISTDMGGNVKQMAWMSGIKGM